MQPNTLPQIYRYADERALLALEGDAIQWIFKVRCYRKPRYIVYWPSRYAVAIVEANTNQTIASIVLTSGSWVLHQHGILSFIPMTLHQWRDTWIPS